MNIVSTATFRTPGSVLPTQNLFVLINTGANRIVHVLDMKLSVDATAVHTVIMPIFRLARISSYTGGQALNKVPWGANASHADVVAIGRNTSDGGAQTDIVASPGPTIWQQFAMRMISVVGQVVGDDNNIAPVIITNTPIVLRENQGLLVYFTCAVPHHNPITNHYIVSAAWGEEVVA
jgi:hypothetical protein